MIGEPSAEVDAEQGQARDRLLGQGLLRPGQARATRRRPGDVAIMRVEQLYPFPHKAFAAELKKYPNATEVVWCQDEPQNQGAWFFVQHYIHENMIEGQKLGYAGRPASASPAVGYCAPAPGAAEGAARAGVRQAQGLRADQMKSTRRRCAADRDGRACSTAYRRFTETTWQSSKSRFRSCRNRSPRRRCCSGRRSPASRSRWTRS